MQSQYKQFNMYKTSPSFKERGELVSQMAEAFTSANKGEYLKPTTIAGYIFSRLTNDYMQGVQTPVDVLVDTHYTSRLTFESCIHVPEEKVATGKGYKEHTDFAFSFERVGNYLRTIDEVTQTLDVRVTVLRHDGRYFVNLY